jgi:hypothetical protein
LAQSKGVSQFDELKVANEQTVVDQKQDKSGQPQQKPGVAREIKLLHEVNTRMFSHKLVVKRAIT